MNVHKPLQLSLLYKTFDWDGKQRMAVSLLLGFPLDGSEPLLEPDLWALLPSQIGGNGILDLCMPKPNGEVLLYGSYFSPGGTPVSADTVRLKLGPIDKKLMVFGDRYWRAVLGPSEPEPFRVMPLDFEHAFGGNGFDKNPVGKGMVEVDAYGEMRMPLPNIENPNSIMTSPGQRPEPAGFAPLDVSWQHRTSKLGTYDDKWLKERAPGYAEDLDWNHFNAALPDQWLDCFFKGDEEFELVNMHPEKRLIKGNLPGFRARCFIERKTDDGVKFDEIKMHAETVWFLPHIETGVVLYRGVIEIQTDDASDITHLLAGYENLTDPSRHKDHYEQALHKRIDPDQSHLYMMDTTDLIPDGAKCGYAAVSGVDASLEQEVRKKQEEEALNAKAEAEEALEAEKTRIGELFTAVGIDPAPFLANFDKPEINSKSLSDIPDAALKNASELELISKKADLTAIDLAKVEELVSTAEDIASDKESFAKEMLKTLSRHVSPLPEAEGVREKIKKTLHVINEPPRFPRPPESEIAGKVCIHKTEDNRISYELIETGNPENLAHLLDSEVDGVVVRLTETGQELRDSYREQAHLLEKGVAPNKLSADSVRQLLLDQIKKKQLVAGGDFCGIDLSRQDLSGVNLSGCYLEAVNLSNAKLSGANLEGAILAFANLSRCDLSGANLKGANLGSADLSEALFNGADMTAVQLGKSVLTGAKLIDCELTNADFMESNLAGADFSRSTLPGASFIELNMSRIKFEKAELTASQFVSCKLDGSDFSGAHLDESSWIESNLDGADFSDALMTNTRFPGGTSLRGASFVRAMLDTANLRETELQHADFTDASLNMSDFGGARAEQAVFIRSMAKTAQFIGTDLGGADLTGMNMMEGSLMKARLTRAKLVNANCYGVEFMNATVGDTNFAGTNLEGTKLEKWSPGR